MWTCPKCHAKVDPTFDVCWRCGTTAEGVEDPDFVRADAAGPIDDPLLFSGLKTCDRGEGGAAGDLAGCEPEGLVECYLAHDVMQARDLAERLTAEGIPAVADTQDLRLRGAGAAVTNALALGNPYFGPRIWVRKDDRERARAWLDDYERPRTAER